MDDGQTLRLQFRHAHGRTPYATVTADVTGCELVHVFHDGHEAEQALAGMGFVRYVERELGISAGA